MKVDDLMTTGVLTCSPDDDLATAARKMWDGDCGALPVVDAQGHCLGMITDRDICMAALMDGRALGQIAVSSAMSRDVVACRSGDDVESAAQRMQGAQVRRLPVVDGDGQLAGILSLNDLALQAARRRAGVRRVTNDEVAATLAAVGEHRDRPPIARTA